MLELAPDGATHDDEHAAGAVVLMDTLYGKVQASMQNGGSTLAFPQK
jgi:hypothetical protein